MKPGIHKQDPFDPWLSNQNPTNIFKWTQIFDNEYEIEIDLGAGDGGFVLELAKRNPLTNHIAVERLLGRARKIVKRAVREKVFNVRVLRLESSYFLRWMCPKNSIRTIHIMFPDPWPKRRHFERRLIQPEFIATAHRVLKPGGIVRFATDHEEYFNWTCQMWDKASEKIDWEKIGAWNAQKDPLTDFQKEFEAEGRSVYRASWKKCKKTIL